MSFMSEFREFALKGNVVDLAVGVIIGAAFGKIVDSLVKDVIMPVIGLIIGGAVDFSQQVLRAIGERARRRAASMWLRRQACVLAWGNFVTVADQLHHPRVRHLLDGEGDEPLESGTRRRGSSARRRHPVAARDQRLIEEALSTSLALHPRVASSQLSPPKR